MATPPGPGTVGRSSHCFRLSAFRCAPAGALAACRSVNVQSRSRGRASAGRPAVGGGGGSSPCSNGAAASPARWKLARQLPVRLWWGRRSRSQHGAAAGDRTRGGRTANSSWWIGLCVARIRTRDLGRLVLGSLSSEQLADRQVHVAECVRNPPAVRALACGSVAL